MFSDSEGLVAGNWKQPLVGNNRTLGRIRCKSTKVFVGRWRRWRWRRGSGRNVMPQNRVRPVCRLQNMQWHVGLLRCGRHVDREGDNLVWDLPKVSSAVRERRGRTTYHIAIIYPFLKQLTPHFFLSHTSSSKLKHTFGNIIPLALIFNEE